MKIIKTIALGLTLIIGIFSVKADAKKQQILEKWTDENYQIEMVRIPAGILKIKPSIVHLHAMDVHIRRFYIGKYEVTQKLWQRVMGYNHAELKGDHLPITNITWYEALDFVKKLSRDSGHVYRLPTEFEWEFACRAGTKTDYYFGQDSRLISQYEWHKKNADGKPHPVGLKKPNPWGLYDMTGNVNEWTSTYWDPELFYRLYPKDKRVFRGGYRVVRGSSYLHGRDAHFRSDYQHAYGQYRPRKYLGFRIVRE